MVGPERAKECVRLITSVFVLSYLQSDDLSILINLGLGIIHIKVDFFSNLKVAARSIVGLLLCHFCALLVDLHSSFEFALN